MENTPVENNAKEFEKKTGASSSVIDDFLFALFKSNKTTKTTTPAPANNDTSPIVENKKDINNSSDDVDINKNNDSSMDDVISTVNIAPSSSTTVITQPQTKLTTVNNNNNTDYKVINNNDVNNTTDSINYSNIDNTNINDDDNSNNVDNVDNNSNGISDNNGSISNSSNNITIHNSNDSINESKSSSTNGSSSISSSSISSSRYTNIYNNDYIPTLNDDNTTTNGYNASNYKKRERISDEMDEYRLLSKRKTNDVYNDDYDPEDKKRRKRVGGNKRHADCNIVTHRTAQGLTRVLALKPVDWSQVVPEARMLIRQVPSTIDNWDLYDHFSRYGEVIEVVIKNHLGFVHFEHPDYCKKAVDREKGNSLNGYILDLEVCRQKPQFARDEPASSTTNPSVTSKKHDPRRIINASPDRSHQYRNTSSKQQQQHHQHSPSQLNQRSQLNYSRNMDGTVQLIMWDHVNRNFIDLIKNRFESESLKIFISHMSKSQHANYDDIMTEKGKQGVIAVINVEQKHDYSRTVDLHTFEKSSNGNLKFEVYDNVTLDDAIALVKKSHKSSIVSSTSPLNTNTNINTANANVLANLSTTLQLNQPFDLTAISRLDVNTLATIYDLVHEQLEAAIATQNKPAYNFPTSQPIAPQPHYNYISQNTNATASPVVSNTNAPSYTSIPQTQLNQYAYQSTNNSNLNMIPITNQPQTYSNSVSFNTQQLSDILSNLTSK
ncbi:unnamed protein product [Cunninghamella blakesleeana]